MNTRPLALEDREAWEQLWQAYLVFYRAEIDPQTTELTWQRFSDPAEALFALGAFVDTRLVGFAHYLLHRSTWSNTWYCYLEDMFVEPAARGSGVGRMLIEAVGQCARDAGASQFYWLTHESNTQAISLYNKVAKRTGFIHYRKEL